MEQLDLIPLWEWMWGHWIVYVKQGSCSQIAEKLHNSENDVIEAQVCM